MQQSALMQVATIQWKDARHTDGRESLRTADSWSGDEICSATRDFAMLQRSVWTRCNAENRVPALHRPPLE